MASWYAVWMAVRPLHSGSVSGRDSAGAPVVVTAQMNPRPSTLRGGPVLRHRARRDVVGIAVEIADEARELRRHVGLGPVGLADAIEAIDEEIRVAAHVQLGRQRLLVARRAHACVRDAHHDRCGRRRRRSRHERALHNSQHR